MNKTKISFVGSGIFDQVPFFVCLFDFVFIEKNRSTDSHSHTAISLVYNSRIYLLENLSFFYYFTDAVAL